MKTCGDENVAVGGKIADDEVIVRRVGVQTSVKYLDLFNVEVW